MSSLHQYLLQKMDNLVTGEFFHSASVPLIKVKVDLGTEGGKEMRHLSVDITFSGCDDQTHLALQSVTTIKHL
jgi:hypothetical protein